MSQPQWQVAQQVRDRAERLACYQFGSGLSTTDSRVATRTGGATTPHLRHQGRTRRSGSRPAANATCASRAGCPSRAAWQRPSSSRVTASPSTPIGIKPSRTPAAAQSSETVPRALMADGKCCVARRKQNPRGLLAERERSRLNCFPMLARRAFHRSPPTKTKVGNSCSGPARAMRRRSAPGPGGPQAYLAPQVSDNR